ncbi:MAG: ATP-binding cassette domain-containing protein [Bacilli bacterium]|nr:ATP-binding cassette domain-containing protein [Bacilli bacterium]
MKIVLNNISKKFKNVIVLENVNLTLESGNIYGLSGRNGSGKTIFLKLLCGLIKPTTGEISFDNELLTIDNGYMFNIGALIENPKFFSDLTGFQNLEILANIKNCIGEGEILNALKNVNLYDEKDKKFGNYSLGMKQKLGIAQAIMENQEIIILDEPFSGIEENTVKTIKKLLIKEKDKNKIIIISSHIKEDLEDLTDKILYFDKGNVIYR